MRTATMLTVHLMLTVAGIAQLGSAPVLSVETFTETDAAHPESALRVAVNVTIPEGWHNEETQKSRIEKP